jgi:Meckel syndrome type 1 protein
VERHGDTAEVRVIAERPETLALLQRDQRELDRSLTQAGIATDGRNLSFMLSDGGAGGFGAGRDGDGQRMARGMRGGAMAGDADAAIPAEAAPRRLLSLLDIAV